jgi:Kyakuja-Dileera-Zisupton transposase
MRVSRQMRKLQVSKHFGAVYGTSSGQGNLAIFCPSCPQPGINLPPDWRDLPSWVTRRTITVDGNFHADHIKMRRPDMDVMLSNGQGYMVEAVGYQEYLSVVKEPRVVRSTICFLNLFYLFTQRSTCRNHRAVNSANTDNRRNLDATGVVACCCARHGCFIPTSVCDLQKGER